MESLATTVATTRLDHIAANLAGVRARVGDRLVLAAVKANAYGHGAVEVARLIEATASADWLGVATAGEAVALREAGVRLPILKLSHALDDAQAAACVERDIDLTVVDAAGIDRVARVAAGLGRAASVHLKVDTGMRRIGCEPADAPALARRADAAGLRAPEKFGDARADVGEFVVTPFEHQGSRMVDHRLVAQVVELLALQQVVFKEDV